MLNLGAPKMNDFQYEIDEDGIAMLSWDTPLKNINIIDHQSISDLEIKIDHALANDTVIGIIIFSEKNNFLFQKTIDGRVVKFLKKDIT